MGVMVWEMGLVLSLFSTLSVHNSLLGLQSVLTVRRLNIKPTVYMDLTMGSSGALLP